MSSSQTPKLVVGAISVTFQMSWCQTMHILQQCVVAIFFSVDRLSESFWWIPAHPCFQGRVIRRLPSDPACQNVRSMFAQCTHCKWRHRLRSASFGPRVGHWSRRRLSMPGAPQMFSFQVFKWLVGYSSKFITSYVQFTVWTRFSLEDSDLQGTSCAGSQRGLQDSRTGLVKHTFKVYDRLEAPSRTESLESIACVLHTVWFDGRFTNCLIYFCRFTFGCFAWFWTVFSMDLSISVSDISHVLALSFFLYLENVASVLGSAPAMRKVMWYIIQDFRAWCGPTWMSIPSIKPLLFMISVRNVQPVDCCSCGARYVWPIAALRLLASLNGINFLLDLNHIRSSVFLLYVCLWGPAWTRVLFGNETWNGLVEGRIAVLCFHSMSHSGTCMGTWH